MFEIRLGGREATFEDVFPGFDRHDRLGVVVRDPCGAVGASALLTAAVTAFYDAQRRRSDDFFVYPDYYLFHVGRPLGDHSMLDVWPSHKEVVVAGEAEELLRAINDRAVTRLLVPDRDPSASPFERETLASARDRIRTCLAYSAHGRVADADVEVASNEVSERYVRAVLDPEGLLAEAEPGSQYAASVADRAGEVSREVRERIRTARAALVEEGVPVETYRRITLDEALARL
jgi:hypothetical protein